MFYLSPESRLIYGGVKMKKKLFSVILLFILIINISACTKTTRTAASINSSTPKQLTQKEKLEDFEYMYNILKDNYPYFEVNKRLNGIDWLARKGQFIDDIKSTTNDRDFCYTLQFILGELKNGHVCLYDTEIYNERKKLYNQLPGYNAWTDQFNKINSKKRYENKENNTEAPATDYISPNNVSTKIIDNKIPYIAIHSLNAFNIESDMKIIKPFLKSIKNYKALIIDIRNNGGGSDAYWSYNIVPMLIDKPLKENLYTVFRGGNFTEPFIKGKMGCGYKDMEPISNISSENLKNLPPEIYTDFKYYDKYSVNIAPKDSVGFKGKIYLLVNEGVFSASEALAVFAKDTGFASLVGENTSGDGIGSDPAVCSLPHSGFIFSFTKDMGLTSDGTCNFEHKTVPDIEVNAYVTSDVSKDQAIQAVLKREK